MRISLTGTMTEPSRSGLSSPDDKHLSQGSVHGPFKIGHCYQLSDLLTMVRRVLILSPSCPFSLTFSDSFPVGEKGEVL